MGIIGPNLGSFLVVLLWIQGSSGFDTNRTPYGTRMCQYLSSHTGGSCVFTKSTLSCHVLGRNKSITLKDGDVLFNEVEPHCPGLSKLVESRKGLTWICISSERKEFSGVRRRLLITQNTQQFPRFHQFFFENRSVLTYDFIKAKMVTAITYISRLQKVLVSRIKQSMIVSYDLNSSKQRKISTKAASSIVVDERRQLVFFTNVPKGFVQMTTDGGELISLNNWSICYKLAVDPELQIIYVTYHNKIVLHTYNGTVQKSIPKEGNLIAMLFDSQENVLYYCNSEALHKLARSGAEHEVLAVGGTCQNLIKYGENIYASFEGRNKLSRINLKTQTITDSQTIDYRDIKRMDICAIP